MSAFLRRASSCGSGGAAASSSTPSSTTFHAAAVDVTRSHIAIGTHALLRGLNVSFVFRSGLDEWLSRRSAEPIDLCFIDGNHSYLAVRDDFAHLAPRCRRIMLHDIQDTTTLRIERAGGGGVPSLWQQLRASAQPERLHAFTRQHASPDTPQFGIGLIGPRAATGTAEPDDRHAFAAWGTGEAAWSHLCASAPGLCRKAVAAAPPRVSPGAG